MPSLGMPRKAPVIQLDRAERITLEEWRQSRGLAQEMALRVAIVLLAAQGLPNQAIGASSWAVRSPPSFCGVGALPAIVWKACARGLGRADHDATRKPG